MDFLPPSLTFLFSAQPLCFFCSFPPLLVFFSCGISSLSTNCMLFLSPCTPIAHLFTSFLACAHLFTTLCSLGHLQLRPVCGHLFTFSFLREIIASKMNPVLDFVCFCCSLETHKLLCSLPIFPVFSRRLRRAARGSKEKKKVLRTHRRCGSSTTQNK